MFFTVRRSCFAVPAKISAADEGDMDLLKVLRFQGPGVELGRVPRKSIVATRRSRGFRVFFFLALRELRVRTSK